MCTFSPKKIAQNLNLNHEKSLETQSRRYSRSPQTSVTLLHCVPAWKAEISDENETTNPDVDMFVSE